MEAVVYKSQDSTGGCISYMGEVVGTPDYTAPSSRIQEAWQPTNSEERRAAGLALGLTWVYSHAAGTPSFLIIYTLPMPFFWRNVQFHRKPINCEKKEHIASHRSWLQKLGSSKEQDEQVSENVTYQVYLLYQI
jgi:hypothetical protein